MAKDKKSLSIVLPAFNEQDNIALSIKEALEFASGFADFEIIVVDDGSSDKTAGIVQKIAKQNKKVRLLRHKKNQGYGAAVYDGLKAAKCDLVFFTDSDLQFKLTELKKFLKEIETYDVVIGYRRKRSEGFLRKINAWGWKVVSKALLSLYVRDVDCAFKLFRKKVVENIDVKSRGAAFSAELLYQINKNGYKIKQLPVSHFKRRKGSPTGAKFHVILRAFSEIWAVYLKDQKLVKSRSLVVFILAILLLFLSRILLISASADFFDSTQYVWRTVIPNLLEVMTTGHAPFHPLYLFFSSISYKTGLAKTGILAANVPAVLFGSGSVVMLYLLLRQAINNKIAWLASILYASVAFVFVSQITILIDPVEHFFYFLSLYLCVLSVKSAKRSSYILALLSGLAFGLAAFAHTQVALWVTGFIFALIVSIRDLKKKTLLELLLKLILFGLGAAVLILFYLYLLVYAGAKRTDIDDYNYLSALKYLFLGNSSDHEPLSLYASSYKLTVISSVFAALLAAFGAIKMFLKDKRTFFALFFWLVPSYIIAGSYIYENLYGRALIIALAPLLVFTAYFILTQKFLVKLILIVLVIFQLLVISVPTAIKYHRLPSANEELARLEGLSKSGGVFVSSNVTKTWRNYQGEFIGFGDVSAGAGLVNEKINSALNNDKPAFIASDAIYFPYRRYDGLNYDIRSSQVGGPGSHSTLLNEIFDEKNVVLSQISRKPFTQNVFEVKNSQSGPGENIADLAKEKNIVFGRIVDGQEPVSNTIVNIFEPLFCDAVPEDLTRFDFVFCAKRYLTKSSQPTSWAITDRDGWFYGTFSKKPNLVLATDPMQTREKDLNGEFIARSKTALSEKKIAGFDDFDKLKSYLGSLSGSFYVLTSAQNGKVQYDVFAPNVSIAKTNRIEGEEFLSEITAIKKDSKASSGKVLTTTKKGGYITSGPYLKLQSGVYKVEFYVHSSESNTNLINFEISGDFGRRTLTRGDFAQSVIYGQEFKKETLRFNLAQETGGIEFRVKVPDNSQVDLDYLELTPL